MKYNVIDSMKIGKNTVVTIDGGGDTLKNGIMVAGDDNKMHKILSIGMDSGNTTIFDSTSIMLEGLFEGKTISA